MPRMEHVPEPIHDSSFREASCEKLFWLLVACFVFGATGNSIYVILTHGFGAPIWCWLIMFTAVLGFALLAVLLARLKNAKYGGGWKGRLWVCQTEEERPLTLISPSDRPNLIEVRGAVTGPLDLLVAEERGNLITAKVQCAEHRGITGNAELTLRTDNRIGLKIAFNDGNRLEEVFTHS